jgi:hypothetical protein
MNQSYMVRSSCLKNRLQLQPVAVAVAPDEGSVLKSSPVQFFASKQGNWQLQPV